ncbi:hemagglutinin [Campylobacter jejuni]|nr:hemagglutinin [Campylobacter jejuni]
MTGATKSLVGTGAIKNRENYKETSDLIAKDNISNEVLNSIFNDLKFNSSVDISDLSKFLLTADELTSINQSMDFITALYGQTQDSNNATFANALKEVLGNSYGDLGKANQVIIKTKEILSQNS